MTTVAVIPIKQLNGAKQRLAGVLRAEERQALFKCMVEDVLTAVEACSYIDEIWVVTQDAAVAELCQPYTVTIVPEPARPGLIAAMTHAAGLLAEKGVDNLVFLPGDLPLVTTAELDIVLDGFTAQGAPGICIVPAEDLGGSNCVVCSPPDCLPFGFGVDSFRRHLGLARNNEIEPIVLKLPGIGLDIDTPEDLWVMLERLALTGVESHTYLCCQEMAVMDKLRASFSEEAKRQ
jgi:2-phospho-L-lactate guanylyltransferase